LVSALFQQISTAEPRPMLQSVDALVSMLSARIERAMAATNAWGVDWFAMNIERGMGVKVYDHPFEPAVGWRRITTERVDLLLVRMESLDQGSSELASVFGVEAPDQLTAENVGQCWTPSDSAGPDPAGDSGRRRPSRIRGQRFPRAGCRDRTDDICSTGVARGTWSEPRPTYLHVNRVDRPLRPTLIEDCCRASVPPVIAQPMRWYACSTGCLRRTRRTVASEVRADLAISRAVAPDRAASTTAASQRCSARLRSAVALRSSHPCGALMPASSQCCLIDSPVRYAFTKPLKDARNAHQWVSRPACQR